MPRILLTIVWSTKAQDQPEADFRCMDVLIRNSLLTLFRRRASIAFDIPSGVHPEQTQDDIDPVQIRTGL